VTTEVEHGSRVWRVRTWIRVTAALGWLGLLGQQLGLGFVLRDGSTRSSVVCQATSSWGEPRWFDVAEAVTGVRPVLDDDGDED